MSIKTILFDLDGTILDTNELINVSFEHTFKTFNYSFSREEIKTFNGPPLAETFKSIDPNNFEEMVKTYREFNIEHHDEYVTVFPKVLETLEKLKEQQINMAIVTNKVSHMVERGLNLTGLNEYFSPETVVAIDDVKHPKPHPESVILAMEKVNATDTKSTLMVGDNYHDIDSGHAAGVKTAGVAWSDKGRDYLLQYKPTYMLEDMSDILRLI